MHKLVSYLTLKIFISMCFTFTFLSAQYDLENPQVILLKASLFTNDEIKRPNNNTYQIPTTFKELTFSCKSSYPTEWKFTNAPHKDEYIKDIRITKRRNFNASGSYNLTDASRFHFESNLTLRFKDPSQIQNLTCRGTKKLDLAAKNTSIISYADGEQGCHITLKIEEEVNTKAIHSNRNREGINEECALQLEVDEENKRFNCKNLKTINNADSQDSPTIVIRLITCSNSDECNAIYKSDENTCPNETVVWKCNHTGCRSLNPSMEPAVIVCSISLTSVARRYFVTNSLGLRKNLTLHFDKYNENYKVELIRILPIEENIYTGRNFTVICKATSWAFSYGFTWAIKKSGDLLPEYMYSSGEEVMNESEHMYNNTKIFQINGTGDYEIICLGPVWNSYDWINDSVSIVVKGKLGKCKAIWSRLRGVLFSGLPQVGGCQYLSTLKDVAYTSSEPKEPWNITIEETKRDNVTTDSNITLLCKATGDPQPQFNWFFTTPTGKLSFLPDQVNPYYKLHADKNATYSKITILPSKSVKHKSFTCFASNYLGNKSVTYDINESNGKLYIFILAIVVAVLSLFGFCVACLIIKKQRKRLKDLSDEEIYEFHNGNPESNDAMLLPYNVAYEIPYDKIFLEGIVLGEGQFAKVLTGRVGAENVAIKTLKTSADVLYFKALLSELKVLCYVGHHPNIVNLIGASTRNIRKRQLYIIMEYCDNGCMLKYLRKSRSTFLDRLIPGDEYIITRRSIIAYENASVKKLTTRNLVLWACDIAAGMEFLREKNVIHGDLAARNILISANMQAKVGDFGLAKQLFEYSIYIQKLNCPLPLKWMALESLQDLEFSLDSDIWSYGITLWEIFSLGQSPYPGVPQWDFDSYKLLKGGYRMEIPGYATANIYELMLQCWKSNPKDRPAFEYLRKCLQDELMRI